MLIRVNLNPSMVPTAAEVAEMTGTEQKLSRERLTAVVLCVILIMMVMGSIYGGTASVTDSAAVGCIGALGVDAVRNPFNRDVISAFLLGTMTKVRTICSAADHRLDPGDDVPADRTVPARAFELRS